MGNGNVDGHWPGDLWSDWLLRDRHGADPHLRHAVQDAVDACRDKVLDHAALTEGMTLVDVGTGDGLIAFGAIDRVGPSLNVILTDVSAALIREAQRVAERRGVARQCAFLRVSADRLAGVPDGSADVVTTRAVLAFVGEKGRALAEFFRVLRPGGRIALCEPINQDQAFEAVALGQMLEAIPNHPDAERLRLLHRLLAAQYPSTESAIAASPLTNYSERDLISMVNGAGFAQVHAELHIDNGPVPQTTWNAFLNSSPHPWAPTVRQVLVERFSPAERDRFEFFLRPRVEAGQSTKWESVVYLTAIRPPE